jgi:5-methyltetrahydrofolate--homocysteine methyltransferase
MDDGLLDARQEMTTFLNMIAAEPDIASVPVMIDSSDWQVILAGLKCVQGKSIVNSISLKEGEAVFVEHARDVMRYGAAVVVMCFDEQGQATSYERRIEIAQRSYRILTEQVGMNPLDIIFDPNVLAVATGMEEHDSYAADFIKATGWIRQHLPGAHVSGGVSNLSFSFRGNNYIREAMHAVFLYHAIQQGMDFGIVNPATKVLYTDIPENQLSIIEDVILNRKAGASERLIELASQLAEEPAATSDTAKAAITAIPVSASVEERLQQALIKGIGDSLETDIAEALKKYPRAVDIIEGPLMAGMNEVGRLFGSGKMFLPQVVKTARTMKQAVEILQPIIEQQQDAAEKKAGRVLLATVKGDVHDIGKNIVAVVLACNGYEVIDMGVMVPAEQIVRKAIEVKADIIGLSGLITPSLEEMVNVAHEMQRAGLEIPIMIGGATTSELHVALKIAPVYGGPVVWMKDASQNAPVAARLLNKDEEQQIEQELQERYRHLRDEYRQEQELVSLKEAREKRKDYNEHI